MEGTIKIEAIPGMGVTVEMDVKKVSKFDMLGILDAMFTAFQLDEKDRKVFGITLAAGGLASMGQAKSVSLEIDKDILEILKMAKEKNNETDAH